MQEFAQEQYHKSRSLHTRSAKMTRFVSVNFPPECKPLPLPLPSDPLPACLASECWPALLLSFCCCCCCLCLPSFCVISCIFTVTDAASVKAKLSLLLLLLLRGRQAGKQAGRPLELPKIIRLIRTRGNREVERGTEKLTNIYVSRLPTQRKEERKVPKYPLFTFVCQACRT